MKLGEFNPTKLNEDWGIGGAMAKNFVDRLRGKATGQATGQASRESKHYIDALVGGASNAIQQMIQSGAIDPKLPAPSAQTASTVAPTAPTARPIAPTKPTKPAKAAKGPPTKKPSPKKKKPVMIGGKVMDPKNPDHAKLMKLASKAKKNVPETYDRLNFILESVMLNEAMSVYEFMKTNYLPKFFRGQDVNIEDSHVDSLIRDVQNSWGKDRGKAALTKLGQFAFASGSNKGTGRGAPPTTQSGQAQSATQPTQTQTPTGAAPAAKAPGVDEIIKGIGKVSGSNAPASLAYVVNSALTKFKKIDPAGHKAFLSQIQISPTATDAINKPAAGK